MDLKYLILDIENDSSKQFGCDAGCFLYDPIVAVALKNDFECTTKYIFPDKIKELKIDEDIIVGCNLEHDLLFLWHLPGIQDFFKRGGRIWDVQIVEYYLSGHQDTYPSLRDMAVNRYGCTERIKHIDELLFNFQPKKLNKLKRTRSEQEEKVKDLYPHLEWSPVDKQVSQIPKELVLEDVKGDAIDTEQVFLKQYDRAEKLGMLKLIQFEMDARLATIEMKYNGFKIDQDILEKNKLKLESELKELNDRLFTISRRVWNES